MSEQKDRHLDAPSEANRDKHINLLGAENGDVDPASENSNDRKNNDDKNSDADNGFFTDDSRIQTKQEYKEDKSSKPAKKGKVVPFDPDTNTSTLEDKISISRNNDNNLTLVKDDDQNPYLNEKDQPG